MPRAFPGCPTSLTTRLRERAEGSHGMPTPQRHVTPALVTLARSALPPLPSALGRCRQGAGQSSREEPRKATRLGSPHAGEINPLQT